MYDLKIVGGTLVDGSGKDRHTTAYSTIIIYRVS